jgi:hypothetical protein
MNDTSKADANGIMEILQASISKEAKKLADILEELQKPTKKAKVHVVDKIMERNIAQNEYARLHWRQPA